MKKTTHLRRIRPFLFQTRGRKTLKKSAMVESASASLRKFGSWMEEMEIDCRTGRKRSRTEQTMESEEDDNGDGCECGKEEKESNEKDEVERRIEALQRIVPGGDSLGVDKLFEKTAGYIVCLQRQVKALRTLSAIFERLDKEKTKCGC